MAYSPAYFATYLKTDPSSGLKIIASIVLHPLLWTPLEMLSETEVLRTGMAAALATISLLCLFGASYESYYISGSEQRLPRARLPAVFCFVESAGHVIAAALIGNAICIAFSIPAFVRGLTIFCKRERKIRTLFFLYSACLHPAWFLWIGPGIDVLNFIILFFTCAIVAYAGIFGLLVNTKSMLWNSNERVYKRILNLASLTLLLEGIGFLSYGAGGTTFYLVVSVLFAMPFLLPAALHAIPGNRAFSILLAILSVVPIPALWLPYYEMNPFEVVPVSIILAMASTTVSILATAAWNKDKTGPIRLHWVVAVKVWMLIAATSHFFVIPQINQFSLVFAGLQILCALLVHGSKNYSETSMS